jgi:membrane-bound ClpP family serine protease
VAAVLAFTGFSPTPFAAWGVALVLVGMFLVVLSAGRRGRHAR